MQRPSRKTVFSLRRILVVSLVLLASVPAVLVAWLMAHGSLQAAQVLAGNILFSVAARVQTQAEAHLGQAHSALNGLLPATMKPEQKEFARGLLRNPAAFEPMAFALIQQSLNVPNIYMGNKRGEYFGVESATGGAALHIRGPDGGPLHHFLAVRPGDAVEVGRLAGAAAGDVALANIAEHPAEALALAGRKNAGRRWGEAVL